MPPIASIGRIVHFTHDASTAQEAGGNSQAGDIVPATIVKVWNPETGYVNLMVHNDGPKPTWVTSVMPGSGPRTYAWPIVPPKA